MGDDPTGTADEVARQQLAGHDLSVDPETVPIDDAEVFDRLTHPVQEWWIDQFGECLPENNGFFTPPQKQAIPLIDDGTNTLVCAPTGSGKCVRPDTPLLIAEDNTARVLRAEDLLAYRGEKLADIDDGELSESPLDAFALDDGDITPASAHIYTEPYEGDLIRVTTECGRSVEVTPAHPLLVDTGDDREWRQAGDITHGMEIGVPKRIDLPERSIDLPVTSAVTALRQQVDTLITAEESKQISQRITAATTPAELDPSTVDRARLLTQYATLPDEYRQPADDATDATTAPHQAGPPTASELSRLQATIDPLDENEVVGRTTNDLRFRFTYPTTITPDLADLAAAFLADSDRSSIVGIQESPIPATQRPRCNGSGPTLEAIFDIEVSRSAFGQATPKSTQTGHPAVFRHFLLHLLDIASPSTAESRFPEWVLNAPRDVKLTFLRTYLAHRGDPQGDGLRVTHANEIRTEQLVYLLLAFEIFPTRNDPPSSTPSEKSSCDTHPEHNTSYVDIPQAEIDALYATTQHVSDPATTPNPAGKRDKRQPVRRPRTSTRHPPAQPDHLTTQGTTSSVGTPRDGPPASTSAGAATPDHSSSTTTLDYPRAQPRPVNATGAASSRPVCRAADDNIAWTEVTAVEPVAYDGPIFDLTVPGPHNFVGGRGGLYLHNTLASFTAIIDELVTRATTTPDGLDNSVYCLYISPLKSLANDIHRNLTQPLDAITQSIANHDDSIEIRHAIRHGDTSDQDRQAMLEETPHILNTTPETLAILLNSPKFKQKLESVEYVIVDEIHALADNKRGSHLSLSLERLERLTTTSPIRIGCSATVEPLDAIGEFLVGGTPPPNPVATDSTQKPPSPSQGGASGESEVWQPRDYEVVDARFARDFDIELTCPTNDLINTPREVVTDRFYQQLDRLIADHTNTLVFTNTRSGAERVLHNLRERGDYDASNSGCHHGSLSKDRRMEIESGLKNGELDVVTTSTSLELGIDMPYLDLVVQVGSPKSVSALLQRIGRAGHQLGDTVKGRVIALDRDELIECAVMLKNAEEQFIDQVFVPENAHDVAVQHVYGMAINGPRPEAEIREIIQSAYPYRNYRDDHFEQLFQYLTADYEGLEEKNVYAKIWRDENDRPGGDHYYDEYAPGTPLVGKRGRLARVIYMTNIGTIPDSFTCDVFIRGGDDWVGQLDEEYLDTLEPGDVFVLGGDRFEYRYRRGSKIYVDHTSDRPTVPSWYSERLPLSYDIGRQLLAFQRILLDDLETGGPSAVRRWLRTFPLDEDTVRAITRMFTTQVKYAGPESISTDRRVAIEVTLDQDQYTRTYYVHTNYGRRFNDGLSRLVAYHCAQAANANVTVAVADHGFSLSMPLNRKVNITGLLHEIDPTTVRSNLRSALDGTDLLKRYFRINATRSLMILKRYKGYEKSARQQQVSSEMLIGFARDQPEFAVMEETYREILEDKLNVAAVETFIAAIQSGTIDVQVHQLDSPTPRAFGLATLMASDVVLAEDESKVLQAFHNRVLDAIDKDLPERVTVETDD